MDHYTPPPGIIRPFHLGLRAAILGAVLATHAQAGPKAGAPMPAAPMPTGGPSRSGGIYGRPSGARRPRGVVQRRMTGSQRARRRR